MKRNLPLFLLLLTGEILSAKVTMPYIFSNNMVLQRGTEIPVWGFADAGEKVTVKLHGKTKMTVADATGKWMVKLDKENAGGPYEMKVSGDNTLVFKNILIGDVWLCGGQSNMEWNLARTEGYENELNRTNLPQIRQIKVTKAVNTIPQTNILPTEWTVANKETIGDFSGVAYFFANKMYQETKIPIGILNLNWGGTNVETWIPREGFENSDYFREMISRMPKVSIEELLKISGQSKIDMVEKKLGSKISDFNEKQFQDFNLDDSGLAELNEPQIWEQQGFGEMDGIVWIRKTIFLTKDDLNSDAKLYLTKIDDNDEAYFNGTLVGKTAQYDADRIYTVPKSVLKEGKNVIVVKIDDTGGGGGIYGNPENLKLVTANKEIFLAGKWKVGVQKIQQNLNENEYPTLAYNGMVAPVVPFAVKGFLWYQGESNSSRGFEYNKSFPLLISSWREKFGDNLPFYFVQLSTFTQPGDSNLGCVWCEVREAQTNTLNVKNTGMVVTTDVGNPKDIHPRNKKTVGERLANLALKSGKISPVYKSYKIRGDKMTVSFTPAKTLRKFDDLIGFEISGKDQVFYPAKAKTSGNKVVVWSEKVKNPVAVRYGWKGDDSAINLFTEEGLPVSPFRTDTFKTLTKDHRYQINLKK